MATLPTPNDFSSISIKSVYPGTTSATDSGRVYRLNYGDQYFEIQVTYPPMTRGEVAQVVAFLEAQKGRLTEFKCPLGPYSDTNGVYNTLSPRPANDDIYTSFALFAGATTIVYDSDWTSTYYNSLTDGNMFQAGDYITFANHSKVYMITEIVSNPNSAGIGSFKITPPLAQDVLTTATVINVNNVEMTVFQNTDAMIYETGLKGFVELSLNLREDI
jgi:hypothetical protein